jgi:hypothetical protein
LVVWGESGWSTRGGGSFSEVMCSEKDHLYGAVLKEAEVQLIVSIAAGHNCKILKAHACQS